VQKEVPWIGPLHICYTSPSRTLSYIPQQFFTYSITQILVQMIINGIKYFGLAHTGWAEQDRNISTGTTGEKTPLHGFSTGRLLI